MMTILCASLGFFAGAWLSIGVFVALYGLLKASFSPDPLDLPPWWSLPLLMVLCVLLWPYLLPGPQR